MKKYDNKDKVIKKLSKSLKILIDYTLRLEAITKSKAIDRPDILGMCRLLNSLENGEKYLG